MVVWIARWNVENLFKPPDPFAPNTFHEYEAKPDALANGIANMVENPVSPTT